MKLEAARQLDAGDTPGRLGPAASDVDVVLDYLWGEPAAAAMTAVVTDRADRGKPLAWIQIGAVAGATAAIPSAALRAARLQIVGSGQGSVSTREDLAELPALAEEVAAGTLDVDARALPLAEVEEAWAAADVQQRQADRAAQALLRGDHGQVGLPGLEITAHAAEGRDRIDDQQRAVLRHGGRDRAKVVDGAAWVRQCTR